MNDSKICTGCGDVFHRGTQAHRDFAARQFCDRECATDARDVGAFAREVHQYIELPGRVPGSERCDHCQRLRTLAEVRTIAGKTEHWCQACQAVAVFDRITGEPAGVGQC